MTQLTSETVSLQLPHNPNAAMIEMMYIIDHFRTMLIKESEALESADSTSFLALQDDKLTIARKYEQGMEQMLTRKEELRKADPSLKQRLIKMQQGFHDIAERNKGGLERMAAGTARLHKRIMEAACESALNETRFAYSAAGQVRSAGKASIGISEQV